jgi:hypothetical protein
MLKFLKWLAISIAGLFVFLIALSLLIGPSGTNSTDVSGCVSRGIAYFKEIGSYPNLSDGRVATVVAKERCGRSLSAF